jgi:hypothetical protein
MQKKASPHSLKGAVQISRVHDSTLPKTGQGYRGACSCNIGYPRINLQKVDKTAKFYENSTGKASGAGHPLRRGRRFVESIHPVAPVCIKKDCFIAPFLCYSALTSITASS